MVLFTNEGLRKFKSIDEIIDYFCEIRMGFYVKRKALLIQKMERELRVLSNKRRFVEEYIAGTLKLFKKEGGKNVSKTSQELEDELNEQKYDKVDDSFDYLLTLQIRGFTQERVEKLIDEHVSLAERLKETRDTTEKAMWLHELDVFEKEYEKWLNTEEKSSSGEKKKTKKVKK